MAISLFALTSHCIYAKNVTVKQGLNKILRDTKKLPNISLMVQSMDNGKILYEHNQEHYYTPASVMKFITAVAALLELGENYRFTTRIYGTSVTVYDGVFDGNLYLQFDGDPTLNIEDLKQMLLQLKDQRDITSITGNIYIDDYRFDDVQYGHGWMWDDQHICFSAPVSAIIINHNCFSARLTGADKVDQDATLTLNPEFPYVRISNVVKTIQSNPRDSGNYCPLEAKALVANYYFFSGCIVPKKTVNLSLAIDNVRIFAKTVLKQLLKETGINFTGHMSYQKTPAETTLLLSHESSHLKDLLQPMLKSSDNLITESLLKTIGAHHYKTQGNWHNGLLAIRTLLKKQAGIDFNNARMVDGSGLSRYNLLSPEQLMQLLKYTYRNRNIHPIIMHTLPISGVDGTLRYRFVKNGMKTRVKAKTGSMAGVITLMGYIETKKKHQLAFVLMLNGFPESGKLYRPLLSKIVEYLVEKS